MSKARKHRYFTQQGVALIAVTVATAIVMVLVGEFSTNTNVDMTASRNAEAEMKTHFLARSGMNLSKLIITLQGKLPENFQITDYTGLFMGAFGGSKEEVEGMAAMLGGFAGAELKGLGVPEGSFGVEITTEDNKINLNCARQNNMQQNVQAQLAALFYFEAYNPIFENEDAEGWRRDRDTQVAAFLDYLDQDKANYLAPGAPEDYGYENLRDKYEAKNNYLDSVGEIKLIRGVDDRFWSLFGNAFTVYGDCQLNLSAVEDYKLIANIIFLAAKQGANSPAVLEGKNLFAVAQLFLKMREFRVFSSDDVSQFVTFVKDPKQFVEGLLGGADTGAIDPSQLGIDPNLLATLQTVQGVELDTAKLNQIAKVGPRRTYRVEATAAYGKLTKRIIGVWDTKASNNQNSRTPGNIENTGQGTWVFWREE